MDYIIVSYYTKGTGYEYEAQNLVASLEEFGINYCVEGRQSFGSWCVNAQHKAVFLQEMLQRFNEKSVVWIDADAVVMQYPEEFDSVDADIGVCYRDYSLFPCRSRSNGKELLSGTIYFSNNGRTEKLIDDWVRINSQSPALWDQRSLESAININRGLRIKELPPQYCQIYDWMKKAGTPVIEQRQRSRRYKRQIDREIRYA